jgi:alkaline phosphatase D
LLGDEQEAWAVEALRASVKAGQKWQIVAQQVIMGTVLTPPNALDFLGADADRRAQAFVRMGLAASAAGLSGAMDMWAGYPAARKRLLGAMQAADANAIVLAGDSHNAWAFDLPHDGRPAAVEFAVQSVTSPGYERALKADPDRIRDALVDASPELKWCETSRRGYMMLAITPAAVRNEWVFMDTIRSQSTATSGTAAAVVRHGRRVLEIG